MQRRPTAQLVAGWAHVGVASGWLGVVWAEWLEVANRGGRELTSCVSHSHWSENLLLSKLAEHSLVVGQ